MKGRQELKGFSVKTKVSDYVMGNDIGTGSVTVCLLRSETDLKLHTLLIKFLYWTSDQKAIKLNNVGHI